MTIKGNGDSIYGFFLQARLSSDDSGFGSFDDSLPSGSQLRPCDSAADAVTHTNANAKPDLTFTWKAPAEEGFGDMRFLYVSN